MKKCPYNPTYWTLLLNGWCVQEHSQLLGLFLFVWELRMNVWTFPRMNVQTLTGHLWLNTSIWMTCSWCPVPDSQPTVPRLRILYIIDWTAYENISLCCPILIRMKFPPPSSWIIVHEQGNFLQQLTNPTIIWKLDWNLTADGIGQRTTFNGQFHRLFIPWVINCGLMELAEESGWQLASFLPECCPRLIR